MSKQRSRHAAALRDLGFEPMEEAEQIFLSNRRDRRLDQFLEQRELSERERQTLKRALSKPFFVLVHTPRVATYATDETGTHWCISELIDPWELTSIGFEDETRTTTVQPSKLPAFAPERLH